MTTVLAIDPGSVSAAYAVLSDDGAAFAVGDVPVANRMVDAAGFVGILEEWPLIDAAIIEDVHSMPKQGVASTFRFGMGCGLLRGAIIAMGLPLHLVAPTKWKRFFSLDSDAEKSRALAIRYWPGCRELSRKKDHGRAEALLLARYYLETRNRYET
jgi:hypothetical protein